MAGDSVADVADRDDFPALLDRLPTGSNLVTLGQRDRGEADTAAAIESCSSWEKYTLWAFVGRLEAHLTFACFERKSLRASECLSGAVTSFELFLCLARKACAAGPSEEKSSNLYDECQRARQSGSRMRNTTVRQSKRVDARCEYRCLILLAWFMSERQRGMQVQTLLGCR